MTARHFLFATAFSLVAIAPLAAPSAHAEDAAVPEIANGTHRIIGRINANAVYIRSGPGDNYYPTAKLDQGAQVTVVGEKFDWLKIVPPEGSFSYVAKSYITKNPDGTTGTVSRDEVNVRAGSTLNGLKTSVQGRLQKGAKVQILDERDDYYVIKPPADAYLYVSKQYVQPVRDAGVQPLAANQSAAPGQPAASSAKQSAPDPLVQNTPGATKAAKSAAKPSTQPSVETRFDQLEARFNAASKKTLEHQPVKELLAKYQAIIQEAALPESMKRIADFRVRTLTARSQAKDQLIAVRKMQEAAAQREKALKAEQQELAQEIRKHTVTSYTAVGTLRMSSLQIGSTTLYRLTDPDTGRTVVYLRSNDPKYASLLGKFVGVRGKVTDEAALSMKVLTNPTKVATVNPSDVFKSISAEIVPPSLLPQAAQEASSHNQ